VRIIGCHWPIVPHGLMVRSGIDRMADIKGRSVAVSAPGSFPDMFARVAMANSTSRSPMWSWRRWRRSRPLHTALIGGVVEAAVVSNEYLPPPSSKNFKMLVTGSDAGPRFLRVCMFSTGKVLPSGAKMRSAI